MPSSTTNPVARTIASKVSTFMENPKMYIIKNEPISDTGISMRGRNAITQSLKNRKMIITTRIIAIINVSVTSFTDWRTNFDLS